MMCQQTQCQVFKKAFRLPHDMNPIDVSSHIPGPSSSHPWHLSLVQLHILTYTFSLSLGFCQGFSLACFAWKTPTILQESQGISLPPLPFKMLGVLPVYSHKAHHFQFHCHLLFFFLVICKLIKSRNHIFHFLFYSPNVCHSVGLW